ncbi:sulfotransferase domain-containing protein [Marinobacter sp. LN3S78]|uniref:sulfotransferase domain-containing protein n=1 Tax=Marinobacter sp. LN3S78 TaxID=3382300 RepID=UPI00387B84DD
MRVDVFHVGPQKTATTWAYHCLQEHPEIVVPSKDAIHYFDMNFPEGLAWFENKYPKGRTGIHVETTPSYIRSNAALRRIKRYNKNAKIIICVRNPLERMVSHYWHEKKKGAINYEIEEVFENYDLFNSWIETSLYGDRVSDLFELFGKENVLVQVYDDLKVNSSEFLKEMYKFIGVDDFNFEPPSARLKINKATVKRGKGKSMLISILKRMSLLDLSIRLKNKVLGKGSKRTVDTSSIIDGLTDDFKRKVYDVTRDDVRELSDLLDRDMCKEWGYER